ncbi:MAG: hypothetical protein K2Y23_14420 [Cyanobacteria bacterium]|nr:hypothetical protein [Cyanobacteriota bacterium]
MSTSTTFTHLGRLVLAAACGIAATACGGDLLRTGRGPMMLVIDSMEATPGGGGSAGGFLLSDVQVMVTQTINGQTVQVPTIFNDTLTATIRTVAKNPAADTTQINGITLTRYRVVFRRTDGRNTPGVDVPYGFDGGLGVTISPGNSVQVPIEIVRHQAKLEPPLKNLAGLGGQGFISTIAEITFYGRDQNGNEASVTGRIDVQFGDFGDS